MTGQEAVIKGKTVASFPGQYVRNFLFLLGLSLIAACSGPLESSAAPHAAHVMDARTGKTLHADNADARLHPASLTKMMTLYIAFEEIERGNLSLDTMVTVSANAAAQPPSRLGLKAGQKIALRYLIRAAAVKSANDAASAIGDHIGGNQEKFAARMTRTAKALGMSNTTFKNASGLTSKGHLSTARDMSTLGRRLFYDFPSYYNIFSRRTTDAGIAEVANTNRRFLDAYEGADGIKTGYTDAAGFNLTASAERGNKRIIATVFGGKSTADRNAKMADLLDLGFGKAPNRAREQVPDAPDYQGNPDLIATDQALPEVEGGAGKTLRVTMAMTRAPRPLARPSHADEAGAMVAAMQDGIAGALAEATAEPPPEGTLGAQAVDLAAAAPETVMPQETLPDPEAELALAVVPEGTLQAQAEAMQNAADTEEPELVIAAAPMTQPVQLSAVTRPAKRNQPIFDTVAQAQQAEPKPEIITRVSTSGGRHWGINVGRFNSRGEAERTLIKTQLSEGSTLNGGLRKILSKSGGYDANFMGLSQEQADLACRRLHARAVQCFTMGP